MDIEKDVIISIQNPGLEEIAATIADYPALLLKYLTHQNACAIEATELKTKLKAFEADLTITIKENPATFFDHRKPTIKEIDAKVASDDTIKRTKAALRKAEKALNIATVGLRAIESKGRSLDNLVKLIPK